LHSPAPVWVMKGFNYLGNRISLISKSEIRYEGILYAINVKDSALVLQNVRSFGTEDRKSEGAIPPSQEEFGYIIFRSTDIKDLQFFEPPKSDFSQGILKDSAIIAIQNQRSAQPVLQQTPQPPSASIFPDTYVGSPYYGQSQKVGSPQQSIFPDLQQNLFAAPSSDLRSSVEKIISNDDDDKNARPTEASNTTENTTDALNTSQKPGYNNQQGHYGQNRRPYYDRNQNRSNQAGYQGNRNRVYNNDERNQGNQTGDNSQAPRRYSRHNRIPNTEFDIQRSNAKFNKENIVQEIQNDGTGLVQSGLSAVHTKPYDKTSFFDSISCDALDRLNQKNDPDSSRISFRDQRRLDEITFGRSTLQDYRRDSRPNRGPPRYNPNNRPYSDNYHYQNPRNQPQPNNSLQNPPQHKRNPRYNNRRQQQQNASHQNQNQNQNENQNVNQNPTQQQRQKKPKRNFRNNNNSNSNNTNNNNNSNNNPDNNDNSNNRRPKRQAKIYRPVKSTTPSETVASPSS
jgi:protein LSM14